MRPKLNIAARTGQLFRLILVVSILLGTHLPTTGVVQAAPPLTITTIG